MQGTEGPGFDPSDPATQVALELAASGQVHPDAPIHQEVPPEGLVATLMHNLAASNNRWKDTPVVGTGLGALMTLLDAPLSASQAMTPAPIAKVIGNTPESQRAFADKFAAQVPAPSWTQILNPVMGGGQFAQELMSQGDTGRRWSPDTIDMGLDIARDPTSYLGLGIFKRLGAAVAAKGAPRAIVKGLEFLDHADTKTMEKVGEGMAGLIGLIQDHPLAFVNKQLASRWPQLEKWTEYYKTEQAMGTALQWLEQRGWDLDTLRTMATQSGPQTAQWTKQGKMAVHQITGQSDITAIMDQLPTALRGQIDPQHLQTVIEVLPGNDLPEAMTSYRAWLRKDMGLNDPNKFRKWYGEFNDWFKNQALGSLNYLFQNLQGGTAMGQMVGVDAPHTLSTALDNIEDIAKGKPFTTGGAEAMSNRTGLPVPYALHEQADRALNAQMGTGTANPLRDSLALGLLGAVGGGAPGAVIGAGIGSRIGAVSERIRKSSQGIETVLRERGWEEGMSRALVDSMAEMEQVISDALLKPGARASGTPVHQNFVDGLTQYVQSRGGQISTQDIRNRLVNAVRVTPDRADDVVNQLDDILYNASQKGIDLSNKFNFDYQDLSAMERVITEAFPFSTWLLKATPFFLEQGARHPLIVNTWKGEANATETARQDQNLPDRFRGTMKNSTGSSIISAILGRPVEMFNDPLKGFFPFQGATQALSRMQYEDEGGDQGLFAKLYSLLNVAGLSPAPVGDILLRNSGLVGSPDDPARGYIRWGGPVAGVTALANEGVRRVTGQENTIPYVDINRGTQKIEETLRPLATGQQVTRPLDVAAERRVDEIALRETGKPIGSKDREVAPYVVARQRHSGPIWEKALAEVELEKGLQSTAGFVSQGIQPQAILTPEEKQIRGAKKDPLVDMTVSRALDKDAEKNPTAQAKPEAYQAVLAAVAEIESRQGVPTPKIVLDRLASPTNANIDWVNKEIYKWEVEQDPLLQGYGTGGSPEKRRIGNVMASMSHAGQALTPQEQIARIQQNRAGQVAQGKLPSNIAAAVEIPGQEREALIQGDPLVQEYLAWKTTHPGMEVEDFLREKFYK